jgi:hypothetical protein
LAFAGANSRILFSGDLGGLINRIFIQTTFQFVERQKYKMFGMLEN